MVQRICLVVAALLAVLGLGCAHANAPPPAGAPASPAGPAASAGPPSTTAPSSAAPTMAFEMMPGADPCPNGANAPLTGNGALNCPGFPFDVTFPAGAKVKREDAGPMRTFMADLSPGAAAVGVLAWPSFVTPPTPLQIRDYLDKSLDGALKELRAETLGPIVDVPTFPGQPGRGVDFASKAVRGRMELHQVDGWIVRLVVGGPPTSPVALGTPSARSFLSSLRLRPRTAPRARMKRTGPVDIPIPEYAWES